MTDNLPRSKAFEILENICLDMEATQEQLRELDARTGDGDLGVTIKLGFSAVRENLPNLAGKDLGTILIQSGMVFNRAAASTFGTLMATALMRAGKALNNCGALDAAGLAAVFKAAVEGIMQRGGAAPGDRTMLDALVPAQHIIEQHIGTGQSLAAVLAHAAEAAAQGAEATAKMSAKHGRAGWLADKSLGVPDAGATAIALLLEAVLKYL
jgi:phosphoenolpyruvate---glycerone phosphotransferase subunit DhaL